MDRINMQEKALVNENAAERPPHVMGAKEFRPARGCVPVKTRARAGMQMIANMK
jgi:hypothetical protein